MIVEKYIYVVTKELPKKMKKEIAVELNTLIEDMLDGMEAGLSEQEKIEKVLRELGNPKELADSYRGKERYLIGPKYFETYLFVLKIVALSIFIGISVASGVGAVFSIASIAEMMGGYITALFSAIVQGAAWVTGIFAILEFKEISVETGMKYEEWDPSQLPELPHEKALISRTESIVSIMIVTILLTVFFFLPEIIGFYYKSDGTLHFYPLFSVEGLASFKGIIFLVFTSHILIELIKIIKGRWTVKVAIITTALNVFAAGLFVLVIFNMHIWNTETVQKLKQYMPISFERLLLVVAAIIIIITIGEAASALYKGKKYGDMGNR